MSPAVLLSTTLSEIFCEASLTGNLTKANRYRLMKALLGETLPAEEIATINRLLQAVKRGRIAIADREIA